METTRRLGRGGKPAINWTGRRVGRLIARQITERPEGTKTTGAYWICDCDCGQETIVASRALSKEATRSCGCLYRETRAIAGAVFKKDGRCKHYLFGTWNGMYTRCFRENMPTYANYGGRGISMCPEWRDNPLAFYDWVDSNLGVRPEGGTLDRIDNNGDYEPGNLRWASRSEQTQNQRAKVRNSELDAERAETSVWRDRALALGWTDADAS